MAKADNKKIDEVLSRAVEEVIVEDDLRRDLASGKKLRVKFGIDPTSPHLHLGHSVALRKLRQFQDLGHKIIFLIGDFTAAIGDPSGRNEARKPLGASEIRANEKTYLKQAGKIIDIKKAEVCHNSKWYNKLGADFIYELLSKITVQQAMARDDFQKRIKQGRDVSTLEVIYPLLQGYDSVELKADLEIGGTDQKFNLLMGRKIQRRYGQKEQNILTTCLIEGTDGVRKMSKSFDNYIGLTDEPDQMFGKIMSIPDDLIIKYFTALTDTSLNDIEDIKKEIRYGNLNPKDAKINLAETVVEQYWGKRDAGKAKSSFQKIFSEKKMSPSAEIYSLEEMNLLGAVALTGNVSLSEARRLIHGMAVRLGDKVITDPYYKIKKSAVLRIGKKRFVRIKVK